ncbi:Zinc finger protein [Plakobranchus ocellatus]|uniref:Zinc finger protein n=1 Tax=Plakobranchus ocellatus TaxID=259542 RepID=A0AAV4CY86_9GAST|nr:Zinc finger protein [Plakobranchus ocellatus]
MFSCDEILPVLQWCHRTVQKGMVPRIHPKKVSLINKPFNYVATDVVGLINPPSEVRHIFIPTLIEYVACYAEALSLRKIDAETVAKALMEIYRRLGVREEVLSDQGTPAL